jgi:DNA-binding response OmpR family regulator
MSTIVLGPGVGNRHRSPAPGDLAATRSRPPAKRRGSGERSASQARARARATVRCADVVVDLARQRATRGGRPLALTRRDLALLAFLMRQAGQAVTRPRLSRAIWKRAHDGTSNYIEVGMWRLRAKIDGPFAHKLIHAVRGVGYRCAVGSGQEGLL